MALLENLVKSLGKNCAEGHSIRMAVTKIQRENIERFKRGGSKVPVRKRRDLGMPAASWWLGLGRKALSKMAKKEEERMRHSPFGLPPSETLKGA